MSTKDELTDFCYRFILTSAIALFLFLEIYNFYDPELIVGKNVISVLIISLSFNVLLLIFHKIHFYLFPAIFLVIALFILFTDDNDAALLLESMTFKLLILGFIAFVIFLTSDTSVAVNIILSLGLIIYMMIMLFRELDIHPASPALAMFYIVFSVARVLRHSKLKDSGRLRRYITFLLPFLLSFPLIIVLLPKPESPISWQWAKELYDMTVEKINEISHELSLRFSSSEGDGDGLSVDFGYSDSMDYDNSSDDNETIMELYSETSIYGYCYLKGEIFNVFEDGNWKNTLDTKMDYTGLDTLETIYGVINFDREAVNDLLKKSSLNVRFLDLTTRILFSPSKLLPIDRSQAEKNGMDPFSYDNEHLLFDERKTYGTRYSVDYLQLNYGSKPFLEFMNSSPSDNEDAFTATKSNSLGSDYKNVAMSDITGYRDYVNRFYVSEPKVRDSVKEWLYAVTSEGDTDYEKLKAVEANLSCYEYSLSDGQLPGYVKSEGDFLDYFLIEKQSGYCVHYATAFCLLARLMGYPSRVIQGYIAPVEAGTPSFVLNSNGHTWAEVYFPGKGWIAFEPTPGYGGARYGRWNIYSGKYSDYKDPLYDYQSPQFGFDRDEPITAQDEEYLQTHTETRVSGMLILIIVSIIVISLILLVTTSLIINRIKKKRLSTGKLYSLEFRNLMGILRELKISRGMDETLEEFTFKAKDALRVLISEKIKADTKTKKNDKYSDVSADRLLSFMSNYEKFLYGKLDIGDPEMNEIAGAKDRLMLLMKKVYGATYPIHKLRLYFASSIK